jgi:hypothetical protein
MEKVLRPIRRSDESEPFVGLSFDRAGRRRHKAIPSPVRSLELRGDKYHTFRMRKSGSSARSPDCTPYTAYGVPQRACYFDGRFLAPARFRTSVGDMSIGPGRGCSLAMCVERRFVETCSPQNLQRALPGEMWTRCIHHEHEWLSPARQARVPTLLPRLPRAAQLPISPRAFFAEKPETRDGRSQCASADGPPNTAFGG